MDFLEHSFRSQLLEPCFVQMVKQEEPSECAINIHYVQLNWQQCPLQLPAFLRLRLSNRLRVECNTFLKPEGNLAENLKMRRVKFLLI
jgi:hypothetical protein